MRCHSVLRLGMVMMTAGIATAQTDLSGLASALPSLLTVLESVATSIEATLLPQPSTSATSTSSTHRSRRTSTRSTTEPTTSPTSILTAATTSSSTSGSTTSDLITSDSASITSAAPSLSITIPNFSSILPASTAISSLVSSVGASDSNTGLTSRTRDIIIGVTVPIGLIILAAIIVLLVVCHRRRKRRSAEPRFEETRFIGNNDWEWGDNSHHGYNNTMETTMGSRDGPRTGLHSDITPLMRPNQAEDETTANATSLPYPDAALNAPRLVSINRPITRKPVPNRASNGSAISSTTAPQRDSHHEALLGAGIGALAGVAASHHHNNNRYTHPIPAQSEHHHSPPIRPFSDQPSAHSFDDAREDYFHWQPTKPLSPPFSPDDVGITYRRSQQFSQAPIPPEPTIVRNSAPVPTTGIIAPTASQRRSLQNRHSGNLDRQDRRPSLESRHRSLSGGGEVWQADSMFQPALSSQKRESGNSRQYTSLPTAPPLPSKPQRQRTSDGSQTPLLTPPAAPYNRHLANARAVDAHNKTYGSNTDSSTSGDSWESAQAEINAWDDTDPGRYPRFSNETPNSRVPLIPPRPVWQDGGQRRWSDEAPRAKQAPYRPDYPRYSGGNERRQRLRFSEMSPEYYDEGGLVGRAL